MAGEWRPITLGDVLSFANGKTSPERSAGLRNPVYGSNGIIGFAGDTNAPENTIVIGRVGSYCGSLYLSKERCWVTDNAIRARALDDNDARFLFYLLSTLDLNHWRAGSGQPLLNQTILSQIPASVPLPDEQRAIAHILGTLDDKIELNRRMNETLEAMARAIFKSWFVDFDPVRAKLALSKAEGAEGRQPSGLDPETAALFPDSFQDSPLGKIPKGWNVGKLSDLCTTQYGYTASATEEPVGPKFLRVTDINKHNWIKWDSVPYCLVSQEDKPKYSLAVGDIVVARMADPGKSAIVEEPIDALFASYLVRLKTESLGYAYFVYGFLKSAAYTEYSAGAMSGSVQANMNAKVIVDAEMVIPTRQTIEVFLNKVLPLRQKVVANLRESMTLAALRDALLPKLISGEIRVKGGATTETQRPRDQKQQ